MGFPQARLDCLDLEEDAALLELETGEAVVDHQHVVEEGCRECVLFKETIAVPSLGSYMGFANVILIHIFNETTDTSSKVTRFPSQ